MLHAHYLPFASSTSHRLIVEFRMHQTNVHGLCDFSDTEAVKGLLYANMSSNIGELGFLCHKLFLTYQITILLTIIIGGKQP